jgi:Na+/proline symporter
VGVCSYAVVTGFPILLIAFAGERITGGMPHAFSLSDFVGWRFGPIAKTVVALIALFNMCIVLLAEYTTIGSIFSGFVGSVSWGIILVIATLTMSYTTYGGLVVSIATGEARAWRDPRAPMRHKPARAARTWSRRLR